jgi:hypothetical protein
VVLLIAVLGLAILAALTLANLRFTDGARDANAFLPRWAGAHAWLTQQRSPYDPQVSISAQTTLYGRPANPSQGEDRALFAHPLPVMLFYAGFGLLDYPVGRAVWMTLLEVALPLSALLAIRLSGGRWPAALTASVLIVSLAWSPGVRAIVAGSAAPLALLLSLASLSLAQRHWDLAAGAVLSLAMVDPLPGLMLSAAVCIWAMSNGHRRLPAAAAGTLVILVAASQLLLPGWPIVWLRQLAGWVGLGTGAPPPSDWPILQPGLLPEVILGALLLASFWSWWPRAGGGARTLVWTAAFTLVMADWIGLLVLGRASLVYLLPAIVLILGVLARRGRATGSWPGIIGIALAAFISWAPALLSVEGEGFGVGGASMGLLATVLGLLWVRWWVTRGAEIRTFTGEAGAEG